MVPKHPELLGALNVLMQVKVPGTYYSRNVDCYSENLGE